MRTLVLRKRSCGPALAFHEEGLYAFRFDVNDDAHEEVTFKIRFGEVGHAEGEGPDGRRVQTLEVCRATGRGCRRRQGGRGHRFGHYRPDRRGRRGCADLRWPGPGSVVASTGCGPGGRVRPQIAWAKLDTLVKGAELAASRLWG